MRENNRFSIPFPGRKLAIYGAGGGGQDIQDIFETDPRWAGREIVFLDDGKPSGTVVNGRKIVGGLEALRRYAVDEIDVVIGVGLPQSRRRIADSVTASGYRFASICCATALVRANAEIGTGVIVSPLAFVNRNTVIGDHVLINVGAIIGHDVAIGAWSVVSPGVMLLGGVKVGAEVELGSGAVVLPGLTIGARAKIAMGATVFRDVAPGETVGGNPARVFVRL